MDKQNPVLSAGVIIVHLSAQSPRYLVLRVHNYWDFPKGLVEPGESPLQAAIREVEEETTLTGLEFLWGEGYRETESYRYGKIARYYVAASCHMEVDLPVSEELGHPEHEEYRWLEYSQARELLNDRVGVIFDWAHALVEQHRE